MNFKKFLKESLLIEGGNAIKISTPISQLNAKSTIPRIVDLVLQYLSIKKSSSSHAIVGSVGKKENEETSGDIDIIINLNEINSENKIEFIEKQIEKLAKHIFDSTANSQQKFSDFYRSMKGIGIFSFAFPITNTDGNQDKKYIQVDVTPVENIEFSKWSNHSDAEDIKLGLKGSHRNELLYAIAKYSNVKRKTDINGNLVKLKRHFYDRSRGLFSGTQTREGKNGKLNSSYTLENNKQLVSNDINEIVNTLFSEKYKPEDLLTFSQVYKAIHDKSFKYPEELSNILKMAKAGILNKKLKLPKELE